MKLLKALLFICLIFSLQGKSQGFKTLTDSAYTLNYPKKWVVDENSKAYLSFLLFAPVSDDPNSVFRINICLLIQDLTGKDMHLEGYVKLSESQIKTMIPDAVIAESKTVMNKDGEFHQIIYEGKQGSYLLKWKQYYFVKNNKAFVLTYTAEKSTYDRLLGEADIILNSFRLK